MVPCTVIFLWQRTCEYRRQPEYTTTHLHSHYPTLPHHTHAQIKRPACSSHPFKTGPHNALTRFSGFICSSIFSFHFSTARYSAALAEATSRLPSIIREAEFLARRIHLSCGPAKKKSIAYFRALGQWEGLFSRPRELRRTRDTAGQEKAKR